MNMSQDLKTDLLPKLRARYQRRNREGKTRMLDDLCEDYGYERKYAIKLLRDTMPAPSGRKHPGPEPRYTLIEPVVRTIWLCAEQPCGKRLAPALPLWLRHYERHHDKFTARQRELLREVSPATLDRLLAPARAEHPLRGRCATKPGTLLKTEIPIRTGAWDVTRPGYLEADSVAHCVASLAGDFIWSLVRNKDEHRSLFSLGIFACSFLEHDEAGNTKRPDMGLAKKIPRGQVCESS